MNVHLLRQWISHPTSQAFKLVNKVLTTHPDPLSTKDIFKLVHDLKPAHPVIHELLPASEPTNNAVHGKQYERKGHPRPPHPDHPIRSIRYLKNVVLPTLEAENKVEKIHLVRTPSESETQQRLNTSTKAARKAARSVTESWLWRIPITRPAVKQSPKKSISPLATAVGVHEDWSHLNKRRRRARVKKVQRDLGIAKAIIQKKTESRETSASLLADGTPDPSHAGI